MFLCRDNHSTVNKQSRPGQYTCMNRRVHEWNFNLTGKYRSLKISDVHDESLETGGSEMLSISDIRSSLQGLLVTSRAALQTHDALYCPSMDVCELWSKNQDERVATGKSTTMRR
jgi:hypothetical protein